MFSATIEAFDVYYRCADARDLPGFNRDLGCEVRERLLQLRHIVKRVRELEALSQVGTTRVQQALEEHIADLKRRGASFESEPAPLATQLTEAELHESEAAIFEMKLLTESFYYLAGRVRTILRHKGKPLPGLQSFECKGVRDVRNKLLEHAEGADSLVSIQSLGFGGPNGPVLKAVRYSGQEKIFPDVGLYKNAEEFCANLEAVLQTRPEMA